MKTTGLFSQIVLIILLFTFGLTLSAQEKKEDPGKFREEQMQERKKMLEEQQEQMKFMQKEFAEKQKEFAERQREMEALSRETARAPRHSGFYFDGDGDFVFVNPEQRNQSQLTLRKTFTGASDTSTGEFDVEEGVRQFRCVINGKVRSGEINIILEYPNGKTFKDLTINSSADISFSQSMSFKEDEDSGYVGTWKYEIEADEAEGNYMLQIMTN